jgi:hypothetical protein
VFVDFTARLTRLYGPTVSYGLAAALLLWWPLDAVVYAHDDRVRAAFSDFRVRLPIMDILLASGMLRFSVTWNHPKLAVTWGTSLNLLVAGWFLAEAGQGATARCLGSSRRCGGCSSRSGLSSWTSRASPRRCGCCSRSWSVAAALSLSLSVSGPLESLPAPVSAGQRGAVPHQPGGADKRAAACTRTQRSDRAVNHTRGRCARDCRRRDRHPSRAARRWAGLGTVGIIERAEALGGQARWQADAGTHLRVRCRKGGGHRLRLTRLAS